MRRPPALYSHPEGPRNLWEKHLPHLPGRLRAVLALWVEGTLRRRQRELLYDDADSHPVNTLVKGSIACSTKNRVLAERNARPCLNFTSEYMGG